MNDIPQNISGDSSDDKENSKESKVPLADKKKNALLRYMAILFCLAFLLVLLSYLIQMRDSKQTISQLNQSNASALQNAGKLQGENQQLADQNASLNKQLDEAQNALNDANNQLSQAEKDAKTNSEALSDAQEAVKSVTGAYELLLNAKDAYDEGDLETCKKNLTQLSGQQEQLSAAGSRLYAQLQKALTNADDVNSQS